MFMGEFNHSIDVKGRLILPSRFREELGGQCVISKGYEGCLNVYPAGEWDKFVQDLTKLNAHNADARRVLRIFASGAAPCEMDKQGRVVVPPTLREFAKLDGEKTEVVVVGALSKIEVWNAALWREYNEGEDSITLEEAGANLTNFGI